MVEVTGYTNTTLKHKNLPGLAKSRKLKGTWGRYLLTHPRGTRREQVNFPTTSGRLEDLYCPETESPTPRRLSVERVLPPALGKVASNSLTVVARRAQLMPAFSQE